MPPRSMRGVTHMATLILAQLHDVLNSFASLDVAKAVDVWKRDQEVGRLCTGLFPRASHLHDGKVGQDILWRSSAVLYTMDIWGALSSRKKPKQQRQQQAGEKQAYNSHEYGVH